jgi:hypothetical protein
MVLRRTTKFVLTVLVILAAIADVALTLAYYRVPGDTSMVIIWCTACVCIAAAITVTVLPRERRP